MVDIEDVHTSATLQLHQSRLIMNVIPSNSFLRYIYGNMELLPLEAPWVRGIYWPWASVPRAASIGSIFILSSDFMTRG